MNEITNFKIEGNRYYFYGPQQEKVNKVKLDSGNVIDVKYMTIEEQKELSLDISSDDNNLILDIPKVKKSKVKKSKVKKSKVKKSKVKHLKIKNKTITKSNKYWYHKIPEYAMKNITKVKRKKIKKSKKSKKSKVKKSQLKIIKNIPEVDKSGERVPFRGFLDIFKANK